MHITKPSSPADIAEMKARGYDVDTIAQAEALSQRWVEAQVLCRVIEAAFDGVKLGNGVGLQEAQGLDDYADSATLAAYRTGDEKENWRCIPAEALNRCQSSLCFFDAEGMRFHLPAYLIADLQGLFGFGMAFPLTYNRDSSFDHDFALLDSAQRRAVRAFLLFILEDEDYEFNRAEIQLALTTLWAEPTPEKDAAS